MGARRSSAQALALRAGIVLDCASGISNTVVARRRRICKQMVGKWRSRFVRHRVAGLLDEPRCGAPRTVEDSHIAAVIVRTLESVPRLGSGPSRFIWRVRRLPTFSACG